MTELDSESVAPVLDERQEIIATAFFEDSMAPLHEVQERANNLTATKKSPYGVKIDPSGRDGNQFGHESFALINLTREKLIPNEIVVFDSSQP